MMGLSWLNRSELEKQKKQLKAELTMKVMTVERRRGEVETVARNVMDLMNHKKGSEDE